MDAEQVAVSDHSWASGTVDSLATVMVFCSASALAVLMVGAPVDALELSSACKMDDLLVGWSVMLKGISTAIPPMVEKMVSSLAAK